MRQKDDLISRQAAIMETWREPRYTDPLNVLTEMRDRLRSLPSAEPHWIPVSERLPEENVPVLLGIRFKEDFKMFVTSRQDYNYWTGLGREIKGEMRWMPLPEPYKAGEQE